MTKINDGGPAFGCGVMPHPTDVTKTVPVAGLTVRDWFAGQALAAMSADLVRNQEYGAAMRALAEKAYFIADAMLAERSKSKEQGT